MGHGCRTQVNSVPNGATTKKREEGLVSLGAALCFPVPANIGMITSKITSDSTHTCQISTWCKSTQTRRSGSDLQGVHELMSFTDPN